MTNFERLISANEYELAKVLIAEELLCLETMTDMMEENGETEMADRIRFAMFNENTINQAIAEKMEWLKQEEE